MQFYSLTDRGMLRENNEDNCYSGEIGGYTLLVVADGMGGHRGGETASRKAIETVVAGLEDALTPKMLPGQIMLLLSEVLENANREIIAISKEAPELVGMGTTCDICLIAKNTAYIAHIGDSRIYKLSSKKGSLTRLTKDHSLVEYMIETGTITEEEALNHPQKNIILRALGTSPETDADVSYEKLSPGDILLMCSDGLTNMLTEEDICKIISSDNTPEEKAKELVRRANETGGTDNITVVIAEM